MVANSVKMVKVKLLLPNNNNNNNNNNKYNSNNNKREEVLFCHQAAEWRRWRIIRNNIIMLAGGVAQFHHSTRLPSFLSSQ